MADPNVLLNEVSCLNCNSNASMAQLLELALLQRIDASGGGGGGGTPALPLNSVQFNNAGAFGGDAGFTYNNTTDIVSLIGNLQILNVAANQTPLSIAGQSLTGANAQSMVSLAGTWNTTGTPTAIDLNITSTASNGASLLMDLRVGGTSMFRVRKDGSTTIAGTLVAGVSSSVQFNGRAVIQSTADSILLITNNAQTDFNRMNFGGSTSSFPALKRSTTTLQVRLADDSAFANLSVLNVLSNLAATVITSSVALTNGAGAGAGTITNAPAAGNPTKWIGINDNGTIRYVPAW